MSALHGRLNAAMEEDKARFSGEEFAAARLGSVAGSVKRRRMVRSAGVGGASVLGASALAAGVINIPWGTLGSGVAPGSASGVICTTTTPDAVPVSGAGVPAGATWAVVDVATDTAFFVGLVSGEIAIWESDGTERAIESIEGPVELALPSGTAVTIDKDAGDGGVSITASDPAAVEILGAHEYVGNTGTLAVAELYPGQDLEVAETLWSVSVAGQTVATAHLEGTTLVVESLEGTVQRVERSDDGGYHFTVDGEAVIMAVATTGSDQVAVVVNYGDDGSTVGLGTGDSAEPVVDCVTPEPSASPTGEVSSDPEPSATPSTINDVVSAFQCDFDFTTYDYEAGDVIAQTEVTTQAAIREQFLQWYGDQSPTTDVPDADSPAWHAVLNPDAVVTDASLFSFVAVKDGKVVGNIETETNNAPGYLADRDGESALEAFLWDRGALTACGDTSIDDAEIYAVYGFDLGESTKYAWRPISE